MVGDCNPNTPVREKVKRFQEKPSPGNPRTPTTRKPHKGKEKVGKLQPTIVSFFNTRCGLEGPGGNRGMGKITSTTSNLEATGQGLPPGAKTGSQMELGDRGRRQRTVEPGSPEHNLLSEAGVIPQKVNCTGHKEGNKEIGSCCDPENLAPVEGRQRERDPEERKNEPRAENSKISTSKANRKRLGEKFLDFPRDPDT